MDEHKDDEKLTSDEAQSSNTCKSSASLRKAVSKLNRDYQEVQVNAWHGSHSSPRSSVKTVAKSEQREQRAIVAVYDSYYISRESPGMKDTVIIRNAGLKQKRHLMFILS